MNFAQLRTFVETVRRRSFSEAARALGVSQPAVSRQIQKLEAELGVRLLAREEEPVGPTPAGWELFAFAERSLSEHEELLRRLAAQARTVSGVLRIAASTTPGEFLVPRLLAEFTARHAAVGAQVAIMDTAEVIERLLDHQYEIGFTGALEDRPRLAWLKLAEDEIVLAVPAGHPFAGRETIELGELAGEKLIEREDGSGTFTSLRRLLAERGAELPPHQVAMVLGSTQAILTAIRQGLGLGFISNLALASGASTSVVPVRLAGLPLHRDLYATYEPARLVTPVLTAFIDFLQENAPRVAH